MDFDWQTWTTLAVIAATAAIFLRRALRRRKAGGCPGCGGTPAPTDPGRRP